MKQNRDKARVNRGGKINDRQTTCESTRWSEMDLGKAGEESQTASPKKKKCWVILCFSLPYRTQRVLEVDMSSPLKKSSIWTRPRRSRCRDELVLRNKSVRWLWYIFSVSQRESRGVYGWKGSKRAPVLCRDVYNVHGCIWIILVLWITDWIWKSNIMKVHLHHFREHHSA